MKKSKSYRGQRAYKNASMNSCGCFYCTGYSKQERYGKIEKQLQKEISEAMDKTTDTSQVTPRMNVIQGYTQSQVDEIVNAECKEFGNWMRNTNFYYVASQPIDEIYDRFKKEKQNERKSMF